MRVCVGVMSLFPSGSRRNDEREAQLKTRNRGGAKGNTPITPGTPANDSVALPSWMYGDPAMVVEHKEERELVAAERRAAEAVRQHRARFGLVSQATERLINRARIRALMKDVMNKG